MSLTPNEYEAIDQEYLATLKKNSELAFKEFLSYNLKTFKGKIKEDQIVDIIWWHRRLMFVNEPALNKKLELMGLGNTELKWFVSLEAILDELNNIDKKGIKFFYSPILDLIKTYLIFKFSNQMLMWGKVTATRDNVPMTKLSKLLHDIDYRRKAGDGDLQSAKTFEKVLPNTLNEYMHSNNFPIDQFIKISKGRTEYIYLDPVVRECFNYKIIRLSQTKYLSALYDLFKLIMQDHHFESYEEFIAQPLADNKFNTFRAKKIRKYILANKPL